MGRLLKEGVEQQTENIFLAINASGADPKSSWLYGHLSQQSNRYLAFGAYRTEVLFRESAVVGVVGGVGLGWQLKESLSSFAWGEVLVIICTYCTITLIGEGISNKCRRNLLRSSINRPANAGIQL